MDFEVMFEPAPVTAKIKHGASILRVMSMFPSTLFALVAKYVVLTLPAKLIFSMLGASTDDGYTRVLPEFVVFNNLKRLNSYDIS